MIFSWWWLWLVFMFVFILSPVSYGWGYRRWGPPYPRYLQRRRSERARRDAGSPPFDHHAWGWSGDFVWILLFIWIFWLGAALWHR
ncbi:MAG: hypothetical protein ABIQ10_07915 [Gemmatimonadaceae bacterium]